MLTRWTILLVGGPADGRLLYWTPPRDVRDSIVRAITMVDREENRVVYGPLEPDPSDPQALALWAKMQNNHIAVCAAGDVEFPEDVLRRVLKAKPIDDRFPWSVTADVAATLYAPIKHITINLRVAR